MKNYYIFLNKKHLVRAVLLFCSFTDLTSGQQLLWDSSWVFMVALHTAGGLSHVTQSVGNSTPHS